MRILVAERPAHTDEDRVVIFTDGVAVLDGATSHDPQVPPATSYVDTLGAELAVRLGPDTNPATALHESIRATTAKLDLAPGAAPSSTVAIVRITDTTVDVLLLGDTSVVVGRTDASYEALTDNRLNELHIPQASQYQRRLAEGSGYDDTHRQLLQELQRHQRARRNREPGYWIAEADPVAADHALIRTYPRGSVAWIAVATDGARDTINALGVTWPRIAEYSDEALNALLDRCHEWEAHTDPNGRILPRSKRHDDKTLAVVHL